MHIKNSLNTYFASAACIFLFSTQNAPAQEAALLGAMVAPGSSVTLDKHGTCRIVTNRGDAPIMVPANTPEEWSVGQTAFLNNLAGMNGVSVAACGVTCMMPEYREPAWGDYNERKYSDYRKNRTYGVWEYWSDPYEYYWNSKKLAENIIGKSVVVDGYHYDGTYWSWEDYSDEAFNYGIHRVPVEQLCSAAEQYINRLKPNLSASSACEGGNCPSDIPSGSLYRDSEVTHWNRGQTPELPPCLDAAGKAARVTVQLTGRLETPTTGQYAYFDSLEDFRNNWRDVFDMSSYFKPKDVSQCAMAVSGDNFLMDFIY
ncbi:hypothetical protein CEW89_09710 [Celeribacter ethanolicus]|uniref:Uncharacterized protein n=1 Tax=Celeribacter ethanolicus TaxID=1758178 RepID=A0A291GCN5_9RHOB|nr:hypothetical protein [Celeribacter ethanolicus]ATG47814.1 hypothetical protein CEW89_09710 [Celeribacter ethanolicus]